MICLNAVTYVKEDAVKNDKSLLANTLRTLSNHCHIIPNKIMYIF